MTQEQKEKLKNYVIMHKPVSSGDEFIRYLKNGEVIEFTGCENSANNSEYIINNNPSRKIWYSQLSQLFLAEDLMPFHACIILKDGEEIEFKDIDSWDFYKNYKGRRFKVNTYNDGYTINIKSKVWDAKKIYCFDEQYKYVLLCVTNNNYSSIGDALKPANAYFLTEI